MPQFPYHLKVIYNNGTCLVVSRRIQGVPIKSLTWHTYWVGANHYSSAQCDALGLYLFETLPIFLSTPSQSPLLALFLCPPSKSLGSQPEELLQLTLKNSDLVGLG